MSGNSDHPNVKVVLDKDVNFIDLNLSSLAKETATLGPLDFILFGSNTPEKLIGNFLSISIDLDYLYITSHTKQGFMVVQIDNSIQLTPAELTKAKTLLDLHYYHGLLKKDKNLLPIICNKLKSVASSEKEFKTLCKELTTLVNQANKGEIEIISFLPNGEIKTTPPEHFSQEDLKQLADELDNTPLFTANTPSTILTIHKFDYSVSSIENTNE